MRAIDAIDEDSRDLKAHGGCPTILEGAGRANRRRNLHPV